MEWTEEKPEQDGWYWAYMQRSLGDPYLTIIYIRIRDDGFIINDGMYYGGCEKPKYIKMLMGPLDTPEPPKLKAVK